MSLGFKVGGILYIVLFLCVSTAWANSTLIMENVDDFQRVHWDLKNEFEGMTGCAVLFEAGKQTFRVYNPSLAEQRFSPFSTFKIVSAMLGLKYNVVHNAKSTMHYNGTEYWHPAWNGNITFKQAFQNSAVWYFRQLIDKIPVQNMQKDLQDLDYGNADVSAWQGNESNSKPELNGFWLNSSLRISPYEQALALYKVFSLGSAFDKKNIQLVEDFMQVDASLIYGKTGSDGKGQSWFVGFIKRGIFKNYFAFYVKDAKDSAPYAKDIALKFFKNNGF